MNRIPDLINIQVQKSFNTYIATGFTPNEDGTNDWLYVQGDSELTTVRSMSIYNRWGELVFATKDTPPNVPELGWDGYFQGQKASRGIYGWIVEVEFSDGDVVDTPVGENVNLEGQMLGKNCS